MADLINIAEVEFSALSMIDGIGRVFRWRNRLFRGIHHESVTHIRQLFACGLIDELVRSEFFPKTWITDYQIDGFELVVEHQFIEPVTYPFEWSFLMLRDAAELVLHVNQIARKYGYQTVDCHGFNIVFDGATPRFVDLGSFSLCGEISGTWPAYEEFLRFYYYPLRLWSVGDGYSARLMLLGSSFMPHESYLVWRYSLLRSLSHGTLCRLVSSYYKFRGISRLTSEEIRARLPGILGCMLAFAKQYRLLPLQSVDLDLLKCRVRKLDRKSAHTPWGDYHNQYQVHESDISTPRFERILEILGERELRTVLDLAGNQGVLSRLLVMRNPDMRVVCVDSDENAIDTLYANRRDQSVRLTPVLADFVFPLTTYNGKPLCERLKADAVLALAITHHLILSAKLPIDRVFQTIAQYSRRYVCIEYMPLGLYDGENAPPLPAWYTIDWFRTHFRTYFDLRLEEELEENRVLFFGEIKELSMNSSTSGACEDKPDAAKHPGRSSSAN